MAELPAAVAGVWAVVVAYNPDEPVLRALLDALVTQTGRVVLVDNTPGGAPVLRRLEHPRVQLRTLGSNLGVAVALNVGIAVAVEAGASHVLLSDQDSLPAPGMVAGLLHALLELQRGGVRIGAIGPSYVDLHTGLPRAFKGWPPGRWLPGDVEPDALRPDIPVLTLITAGTLIPAEVFADVGPMCEALFIDRVDTEWCLRAHARGWAIYGTSRAKLCQRMGEHALRVWWGRWRLVSAYAPLRVYYQVRNTLYLLGARHIDWRWKLRNVWFAAGVVYTHVLFSRNRLRCLQMALRGVRDALLRRMWAYRD